MRKYKSLLITVPVCILLMLTVMPVGTAEAQEEEFLFKVTIIAPGNANMVRRQWGQIFANSLRQIGIDARVVFLDWTGVFDRVLTPPPERVGKTWDEGGFDMQLIGWTPGLIPEPRQVYYGAPGFFAPEGQNYALWENTTSNALLDTFITSTDPTEQNQVLQEWQDIFFEDMPSSQIYYESRPFVVAPQLDFAGDWWLYTNAQPYPEYLTGKTSAVYASTGEIESLIPPLSNSWYDTIINGVIFNGLAQTSPDLEDLAIPALLTSWEPSEGGFKWTFNCRTGVKWHDGVDFTADDVLFSLWALMNTETGSQFVGYYQDVYGNKINFTYADGTSVVLGNGTREGSITAVDQYTVEASLPVLAEGKPYGYFDPYLLTFANNIVPKHIFENIPPAEWTTSVFNTGQGEMTINGVSYNGPVGTGPYKWVSFDPVTQLIHLQKFENYWNRTALESEGLFQVNDYYIKFIADKTPALASLKNGQVDMLDPNYQMQVDIPSIEPSWGKVILQEGAGRQEIGYNMRHPIFGTGVDTPLGQADPSRAAEAAKYVRIAFDYAVPRQLIIDNLLAGFGRPGATAMLPTQPFYNEAISARPYDLAKAKEYLQKAGYQAAGPTPPPVIPSFVLGMSTSLFGTYTEPSTGNILPNREILLMETTDNETYTTSAMQVGRTVTDFTGFYQFTLTPTNTGTSYYYILDRQAAAGSEWKYVTELDVSSLQSVLTPIYNAVNSTQQQTSQSISELQSQVNSLQGSITTSTYVGYAAIIIAIVLGIIAVAMARRR